jgi:SAM-dependent methyltransferase
VVEYRGGLLPRTQVCAKPDNVKSFSDYDGLAWVYNRHWGPGYAEQVMPALEKVLLDRLPAQSTILDLCCGTGNLARMLTERGFAIIGIDGSRQMIRLARENAPAAKFIVADARRFRLPGACDAIISVFDSLNHMMSAEDLLAVFRCVHRALRPGGEFVFDLNMEQGYRMRWRGSKKIIEDDCVCLVEYGYREEEKIAASQLIVFRLKKQWHRSDLTLRQKCYSEAEVRKQLEEAGFEEILVQEGQRDLGMSAKGAGRTFFSCRKPQVTN